MTQDVVGTDRKGLSADLGTHKQKRFPGRHGFYGQARVGK